jgi:hypothetical protein
LPYLCIYSKGRIPALRRYDLADPVFLPFGCNLPDILYRILEILLRRTERRRFLQPMWSDPFEGLASRGRLTSALDRREVESRGPSSTQGDVGSIGWMGGRITPRRASRGLGVRSIRSRRGRGHHSRYWIISGAEGSLR